MAIGSCRTCQDKVADTAISCPHCGAFSPCGIVRSTAHKTLETISTICLVIYVILLIISEYFKFSSEGTYRLLIFGGFLIVLTFASHLLRKKPKTIGAANKRNRYLSRR